VDRLLTLARADHAAVPLARAPVALDAVIAEAVALVRPLAERGGITFGTQVAPSLTVAGDRERLTELVTNVCANAVEYNRERGEVTVEAWRDGGDACLRVRDTGVGIAAEDIPRVFERFYRADAARSRQRGDSGLGLAIARWIAEAHGGTITCTSTVGRGTEMLVRLPLQLALEAADQRGELGGDGGHGVGTAQVDAGAGEQVHRVVAAAGAQQVQVARDA
jgi:signal transduction histidine kinase